MSDERYHQRDRDIFFRGKRVCTCYGTSEDIQESESEGYNRATEVCKHLNETQDLLEYFDKKELEHNNKVKVEEED